MHLWSATDWFSYLKIKCSKFETLDLKNSLQIKLTMKVLRVLKNKSYLKLWLQ